MVRRRLWSSCDFVSGPIMSADVVGVVVLRRVELGDIYASEMAVHCSIIAYHGACKGRSRVASNQDLDEGSEAPWYRTVQSSILSVDAARNRGRVAVHPKCVAPLSWKT